MFPQPGLEHKGLHIQIYVLSCTPVKDRLKFYRGNSQGEHFIKIGVAVNINSWLEDHIGEARIGVNIAASLNAQRRRKEGEGCKAALTGEKD